MGFIWGAFGVHVGSMCAVGEQSELVTPSGEQFDPPWTDLGAFLDPMLVPCWAHVGPMLEAVGHLGASWSVLGAIWSLSQAIFDQHRTEDERQRLDARKAFQNRWFLFVFLGSRGSNMRPLRGAFGVILEVLERSWGPLGRLGGLLEAS